VFTDAESRLAPVAVELIGGEREDRGRFAEFADGGGECLSEALTKSHI
jgi:hypothetical protein